jgi:hypothetical protein
VLALVICIAFHSFVYSFIHFVRPIWLDDFASVLKGMVLIFIL